MALYQGIERKYFNSTVKLPISNPFLSNSKAIIISRVFAIQKTLFYAKKLLIYQSF